MKTINQSHRNSYLVNRAIRSFIVASVLTAALQQLIQITHSVIVGQMVGPDAVSAISLASPLMMIPFMLFLLLTAGASVVASKAAGERNYDKVADVFSVSIHTTLVSSLVVSLLVWMFGQQLSEAICDNPQLLPLVSDYMPLAVGLSFITVMFQALATYTEVDGHPSTVSYALIGSLLLIAGLDVLFIRLFDMGVRSAALSTACADMFVFVWLAVALRRRKSPYVLRFRSICRSSDTCQQPCPYTFNSVLKENLQSGLPFMLTILTFAVCTLLINSMVVQELGSEGMFALSVALSLLNLANLFATGASSTFRAIGSMYYGQGDYAGLRILLRQLLILIVVAAVVCTLAIEVLAPMIVRLYGADSSELVAATVPRLRIVFIMLITFMPLLIQPSVFQVLGHYLLVVISALLVNILMTAIIALFIYAGHPDLLWWAFPISTWIAIAVMLILTYHKHRSLPATSPLTLIPAALPPSPSTHLSPSPTPSAAVPSGSPEGPTTSAHPSTSHSSLLTSHSSPPPTTAAAVPGASPTRFLPAREDISVAATQQSFQQAMDEIHTFIDGLALPSSTAYDIVVCAEELLMNIVTHAGISSKHYIDVSINISPTQAILTVKDDGRPFNPLLVSKENKKLGLSIVTGLCKKIEYNYMYGQNMTFLTFNLNQ